MRDWKSPSLELVWPVLPGAEWLFEFPLSELRIDRDAPHRGHSHICTQAEPDMVQPDRFAKMDLKRLLEDIKQQDHCDRTKPQKAR